MSLPQNPLPPMVSALRTRQESASSWKFVSAACRTGGGLSRRGSGCAGGSSCVRGRLRGRVRPKNPTLSKLKSLRREFLPGCRPATRPESRLIPPGQPPAATPSDPGGCCFLNRSFSYKSRPTASSASKQQVLLNSMWFLIAGSISDMSEFVGSDKLRIGQTPDSVPPCDTLCAHGPRQLRQPRSPRWAAGTVLELRGFATAGTVFPADGGSIINDR